MKAIVVHEYGGPEVLKYEDYADPLPSAQEVLIKVAAAGINPVDLMQRTGATAAYLPIDFPGLVGWDLSGTIAAVGSGVKEFAVGDRVFAWAFKTFAELCVVNAGIVAKLPDDLDLVDAGALPLVVTTGSQLISVASGVQAGQTVLVAGAMGGVGRSAVYTAKDRGATVIAGVLKKHLEAAGSIGADRVLALDDDEAVKALEPVDVIANAVRGKTAELLMSKVKDGGVFASATGAPANAKDSPKVRVVEFVSKQSAETLRYMAEGVRSGKLTIPISKRLPLSEAAAGQDAVANGANGKVLLVV